jgi:hypothetical protein
LNELRRWALAKKNVRTTLNLIRVSMFVLILAIQDIQTVKQVAVSYQSREFINIFFTTDMVSTNTMAKTTFQTRRHT